MLNELKPGDRVMLRYKLKGEQPLIGEVEALKTRVLITWSNGNQSTESVEDVQPVNPSQPETSAVNLMAYGAEKAELQRVLTKRNATIGRLRAANRELRRAMIVKTEEPLNTTLLDAFPEPPRRRCGKVVQDTPEQASDSEPTPLPTVPPRVGGVYRTRNGQEAECLGDNGSDAFPFRMRLRSEISHVFTVDSRGRQCRNVLSSIDLVAEISPPPESAFAGPLEVGGWYEDQDGHAWQCQSIRIDFDSAILATCCRNYDRLIRDFHLDGSHVGKQLKLIRKVDPPGGES